MKKFLLLLSFAIVIPFLGSAQCNTTNATGCVCAQNGQNDCDLLPDITISWYALLNYSSGPSEYSQSGNGDNDGRLRVSGATPNIGYGAFTVLGTDWYICDTDTFESLSNPGNCPDGNPPRNLLHQRIYHKNGNTMTYTDRWGGAMTYHPTHGHNHVDDWVRFTLRTEDVNEPNPLNWPIIGQGAKLGFCLMDYGSCTTYNNHCRDVQTYNGGNVLINGDFPNYGLGGVNDGSSYDCSPVMQGISVGWEDIYGEHLDGMWIDIPPGTCNGDYWIVGEVDPLNFFLESDETNNWTMIPFTLTQQVPNNSQNAEVTADKYPVICEYDQITLTASTGDSYLWSTAETTQSITVSAGGDYSVTVSSQCGTSSSMPFHVDVMSAASAPAAQGDTIPSPGTATLTATGTNLSWFDVATGGTALGTGTPFTTPVINQSTTFYVQDANTYPGGTAYTGKTDNSGGGGNFTGDQSLIFSAGTDFTLVSVKVYANSAGNRDVVVRDNSNTIVASATVTIPSGESRVTLNFSIPAGNNYTFGCEGSTVDLYRNNAGVNYPYTDGVVSVTGSSAGDNYYYHYYDWEISYGNMECGSPRTAALAVVTNPSSIADNPAVQNISVFPNPSDGIFNLEFELAAFAREVLVKVSDPAGKIVYTDRLEKFSGKYNRKININTLAAGIYNINISVDGEKHDRKLMVK